MLSLQMWGHFFWCHQERLGAVFSVCGMKNKIFIQLHRLRDPDVCFCAGCFCLLLFLFVSAAGKTDDLFVCLADLLWVFFVCFFMYVHSVFVNKYLQIKKKDRWNRKQNARGRFIDHQLPLVDVSFTAVRLNTNKVVLFYSILLNSVCLSVCFRPLTTNDDVIKRRNASSSITA